MSLTPTGVKRELQKEEDRGREKQRREDSRSTFCPLYNRWGVSKKIQRS